MKAPVTVVSCLYGDRGYDRFIGEWQASLRGLTVKPAAAIVFADRHYEIPDAYVFVTGCRWKHPQAYYQNKAVSLALTEWVWILDIDDTALPDALEGIEDVPADVWLMGYEREGVTYTSPQMTAAEYLNLNGNPFGGASAIRVEAFRRAGGFPDVAFQDWALWRRLAGIGATFQASDRAHYRYNRHSQTRTAVELLPELRTEHLEEMALAG
jgi:hypothetical protein